MEISQVQIQRQVPKNKSKPGTESLRVRKETKKRILSELATINRKEFGRPVSPDQYVSLAISLLNADHLKQLQDRSLTAKDLFEKRYKDFCDQNGKISKDEFLAKLLEGVKNE